MAVQHWRAFLSLLNLQSTQTSSLVQLSDQRLHTTWQQKLFMKLLGLRYLITYKPISSNRVADAFSRKGALDASCDAILFCGYSPMDPASDGWLLSGFGTVAMLSKLSIDPQEVPRFSFAMGSSIFILAFGSVPILFSRRKSSKPPIPACSVAIWVFWSPICN